MKFLAVFLLLCTLLTVTLAVLKNSKFLRTSSYTDSIFIYVFLLAVCGEEFGKLGTCRAFINKWTYRPDTNECINFHYGGCNGNNNLFDNKEKCEKTCKN